MTPVANTNGSYDRLEVQCRRRDSNNVRRYTYHLLEKYAARVDPSALIPFYFFYLIYRVEKLGLHTFLGVEACVFECYSLVALHGSR